MRPDSGRIVDGAFVGHATTQPQFVVALANALLIGAFVAAAGALVSWMLISLQLAGDGERHAPPAGGRRRAGGRGARARRRVGSGR